VKSGRNQKPDLPRAAVIGWEMTAIGDHPGKSYLDLLLEVIIGAAADAGVGLEEVDGLYVAPDDLCGGMTGALAIKSAVQDLRTGAVDLAIVAAGSKGALSALRGDPQVFLDHLLYSQACLLGPWIFPYAAGAPVPLYAMATQRYMHEHGVKAEAIAALPVVLRRSASANPRAQFRDPITVDDVLASKLICPPIHLLESCPISEGGGALVLASERGARRAARKKEVWITGMGEWHTPTHFTPARGPVGRFPAVGRAGAECCASAGIRVQDVDVAELYGVFAGTELIVYEELGFFPEGRAAAAVEAGATGPGERPALNPSGGRLSLGHAPVATPILETIEVAMQLAGLAGARQVTPARVGLVQAEHGMVNGSMTLALEA
jgi:acetyl-CoA acetyltransferase